MDEGCDFRISHLVQANGWVDFFVNLAVWVSVALADGAWLGYGSFAYLKTFAFFAFAVAVTAAFEVEGITADFSSWMDRTGRKQLLIRD